MPDLEKYEAQASIRGLSAKYSAVERQHQGIIAMMAEAEGDKARMKKLREMLAQNLEDRKKYVCALLKRGVKVKDPFVKVKK